MIFYLGTDAPNFVELVNIPWFVSVKRVIRRKSVVLGDWIMDSGGFSQIADHGKYVISEQEYLEIIDFQQPKLAFCQDWMCEPTMLEKTGLTIKEHQERTLENYLLLSSFNDKIRPVLQGWDTSEYIAHLRLYKKANVNINQLFGVGSICSRNGKPGIIKDILSSIKNEDSRIALHGFGIKTGSLALCSNLLWSADSMAWSFTGRNTKPWCKYCEKKNCSHCLEYALLWRRKVLNQLDNLE